MVILPLALFYLILKNLVLRARSESNGFAITTVYGTRRKAKGKNQFHPNAFSLCLVPYALSRSIMGADQSRIHWARNLYWVTVFPLRGVLRFVWFFRFLPRIAPENITLEKREKLFFS